MTSYSDGKRETHNPEGRAYAPVVWDFYNNGCSLRMLNPQTFDQHVWKLCATLQEFLGSFVGTNMYLTPPGTQGFAPHYDDVEVFIMQLEGKKRWRLYQPRSPQETLPRFSSQNFSQSEIGKHEQYNRNIRFKTIGERSDCLKKFVCFEITALFSLIV